MKSFSTIILHSFGNPCTAIRKEKKKSVIDWKKRSKALTVHDMILYIESPKDIIRELLKLISPFGKVAGYKINIQKSLALFACTEMLTMKNQKEISELIPFTTTTKRIKYLGKT